MSRIVEPLDVIEHVGLGLITGSIGLTSGAFGLQGREEALHRRVAPDIPDRPEKKPVWNDPNALPARALLNPPMRGKNAKSRAWREAEIRSGNVFGDAGSVAKPTGLVASGKLLSESMLAQLVEEQTAGVDLVPVAPLRFRFGLGPALQSLRHRIGPNPRTCYWTGWGGSLGVIDIDADLGFAYVMNRMAPSLTADKRSKRLWTALYEPLAGYHLLQPARYERQSSLEISLLPFKHRRSLFKKRFFTLTKIVTTGQLSLNFCLNRDRFNQTLMHGTAQDALDFSQQQGCASG